MIHVPIKAILDNVLSLSLSLSNLPGYMNLAFFSFGIFSCAVLHLMVPLHAVLISFFFS